jgi:hypothetical protein
MTTQEKVSNMVLWLRQHEDKFPEQVIVTKGEKVVNPKLYISTLHTRIESYWESKNLGHPFKTVYFHAHRIKCWYENNMPPETSTILTPLLD